jgi:hypothetical protein
MAGPGPHSPSPSDHDGEGVRIIDKPGVRRWVGPAYLVLAAAAVAAGLVWLLDAPVGSADSPTVASPVAGTRPVDALPAPTPAAVAAEPVRRPVRAVPPADLQEEADAMDSPDPDDLSAYIRPGDPEPTAAELIEALHHAGIRSGIGAFNPPGTSPPLEGLVVPEDYELPEGFVRHYQVTDEGEPLEAILLFSPDYEFFDAEGRPIEIPENRVVPPELAPPGLPIPPPPPPSP